MDHHWNTARSAIGENRFIRVLGELWSWNPTGNLTHFQYQKLVIFHRGPVRNGPFLVVKSCRPSSRTVVTFTFA